MSEEIVLTRACTAHRIPSGEPIILPQGSTAILLQGLGGAYTVLTNAGLMVRVAGQEVEALGKTPAPAATPAGNGESKDLNTMVWDQLKTIYDPEIPVNVVELGLIYKCDLIPLSEGGHKVEVDMTLTAPGCGMGDILRADAEQKLRTLPGMTEVVVRMVMEPPWHPGLMSEAARLQLGFM